MVSVPSEQQQQQQAELETQLASLEEKKSQPNQEMDQAQANYEQSWLADSDRWTAVDPQSATTTGGATFERLEDGSLLAVGNNPDQDTYTFSMIVEGGRYRALRLEGLLDDSLPGKGPGRSGNSNIVLTEIEGEAVAVDENGEATGEPVKIAWKHAHADHQQPNWPVTAAIDGNISLDDGWAVEGFNRKERRLAIFASDDPWGTEGPLQVTFQLHFGSRYTGHALGRVRLAVAEDFMPAAGDRIWGDDEVPASGMVVNDGPEVDWNWVEGPEHRIHSGKRSRLQQTDADRIIQHYFVHVREPRTMRQGDQLYAWVYLDADTPPQTVMLQVNLNGSWEHRGFWGEDRVTYGGTGVDTPGHRPLGELPPTGEWVRLLLDLEKVGLKAGDKINGIAFTQFGGKVYWDDFGLSGFGDALEWESLLTGPVPAADERSVTLRRDFYRSRHSPEYGVLLGEIESRRTELDQLKGQIPTTLVAAERMEMRSTRLLKRGQYDQPTGEPIPPSVPAFLPPLPEGETANRLGLARWLVDPQHPLFSRVTVNRIWQQLFGTGLVGTSEDFGLQGEWPSHPELLDHLARDFIARDWDLKQFIRSLMTTDTYRMQTGADALVRDARRLADGARDGHAAIEAIVNDVAEKFVYGHPDVRFNDGLDEIPYLSCGITEGSCVDINTYLIACLRAAGFEAGYMTGYFFPEEKNGCCDDMHCWVVTRHNGVVLEWDIAHHLKMGKGPICCGLNPKPGSRVAMAHSMGLDFPQLRIAGAKLIAEPVWVNGDGTLARAMLDIRMRTTQPDAAEAAA